MTWYLILLVISACVLIGQTVLSFIGGEIDVDMDTDLDSSDMLSFKGIVRFDYNGRSFSTIYFRSCFGGIVIYCDSVLSLQIHI